MPWTYPWICPGTSPLMGAKFMISSICKINFNNFNNFMKTLTFHFIKYSKNNCNLHKIKLITAWKTLKN